VDAGADADVAISRVAAAIGEPTRARMLASLLDGRARTATELCTLAEVSPSTATVHLRRLEAARLVTVHRQGRYRYYLLSSAEVASILERLSALAGGTSSTVAARAPQRLRVARTCYDHIAGAIGVALRDRFTALGWLTARSAEDGETYEGTSSGQAAFTTLGIDLAAARSARRRFAFGCLDWTERRYHLGGALGAAFLQLARRKKWVVQDFDSRALRVTSVGRREMLDRLGVPKAGRR